jgi:hypothetical protein
MNVGKLQLVQINGQRTEQHCVARTANEVAYSLSCLVCLRNN